ncbi:hypothetical protein F3647_23175 [Escherichia coli]|uniref:hypothetical protein n=1 Tax=Escherichia coli TaxID=562 RepID=UPI0010D2D626|nr:hypothetical protein [Escherichia coli]VTM22097.1 Uncharacterised protein [Raoultella terrigena]EFB4807364.1 hypothetical protein [Escherichia coli]EFE7815354.1 hypothetical protein [Escherichia coli]EFH7626013.1 hypothetical protein [Escherichia coli]EFM3266427.1 hypothetical protein [Escherichia coli]
MSQYKIEEKIEYDPDGNVISRLWNVYYEDGRLAEGGLLSKEVAQQTANILKERENLRKIEIPPSSRNEKNLK